MTLTPRTLHGFHPLSSPVRQVLSLSHGETKGTKRLSSPIPTVNRGESPNFKTGSLAFEFMKTYQIGGGGKEEEKVCVLKCVKSMCEVSPKVVWKQGS